MRRFPGKDLTSIRRGFDRKVAPVIREMQSGVVFHTRKISVNANPTFPSILVQPD